MNDKQTPTERWQESMKIIFEDYLFKDIDSMLGIQGNTGNCNFRILDAILDGMESLGALLSQEPYDPAQSYLESFWSLMVSNNSIYKGWEVFIRYAVRDILRASCSPLDHMFIFKENTPTHMTVYGDVHISNKMLYEDFVATYNLFVKPLIAAGDSQMMGRTKEIQHYFDSHARSVTLPEAS